MKSDFSIAVTQLAAERKLPKERVLAAIEAALVSAYKKDNTTGEEIAVRLNPTTGEIKVFSVQSVVETVEDPHKEITLKEAQRLRENVNLGDTIETETALHHAGRIAAQTAKQVVLQRLREAERELVYEEYVQREGDIVSGTIQRAERAPGRPAFIVDLERAEAILPPSEQVETERHRPGQRMKFYIVEVRRTSKGPEIVLSRTHKNLLRRLFELEVPEILNGIVQIKAIAREAGSRSKVAVVARQQGVDPVGSCVGLRGIRIQNVVNELQGERIDVIQGHSDISIFIAHALSPAQPLRVDLDEAAQTATVVVPDKQLSLAIGKEGQNARLTAKLTGWKIDIKSATDTEAERQKQSLEGRPLAAARAAAAVAARAAASEAPEGTVPLEPAALVAIPATKPEEIVSEPVAAELRPSVSPEEELLALEEATGVPEVASAEEAPVEKLSEEIWKIPQAVSQGPQIRFAEDILGPRGGDARQGKGRKKGKRGRVKTGQQPAEAPEE